MKITENTLIIDVLKNVPNSQKILKEYNMCCASCAGVKSETLRKGCIMHGVDVVEILRKLDSPGE